MATWNQHPWHEFDNDPWSTWSDMNMTWSHMHRKQLLASISQSSTPVQDGPTKAGLGWPWMRTHRSTPKAHPRQWSMAVSPQVELCRIFWSHLTGNPNMIGRVHEANAANACLNTCSCSWTITWQMSRPTLSAQGHQVWSLPTLCQLHGFPPSRMQLCGWPLPCSCPSWPVTTAGADLTLRFD